MWIKAIAISLGSLDQKSTSVIIFQAKNKYLSSKKEALNSLVEYLYQKFLVDYHNEELNDQSWNNHIYTIFRSTLHNYQSHEEIINPVGWSPWGFDFKSPQDQILIISEVGEKILTESLLSIHPELLSSFPNHLLNDHLMQDLLDNETIYVGCRYLPKSYRSALNAPFIEITRRQYKNGADVRLENGIITRIKYNTGDVINLDFNGEEYRVLSGKTYDGFQF